MVWLTRDSFKKVVHLFIYFTIIIFQDKIILENIVAVENERRNCDIYLLEWSNKN